jgi:hypothetical protein
MTRVNLDQQRQNFIYLTLSLFFVAVSAVGVYLINNLINPNIPQFTSIPTPTPITESPTPFEISPTSSINLSPTTRPSPIPTPEFSQYSIDGDDFSVSYKSNRQIITDTEASGNRYTFYRSDSSLAIHVGQTWSWQHPSRQLTGDFLLDGQPTFRYSTDDQNLVDAEFNGKKYTIQCIHNGLNTVKSECDQLISGFKFLK